MADHPDRAKWEALESLAEFGGVWAPGLGNMDRVRADIESIGIGLAYSDITLGACSMDFIYTRPHHPVILSALSSIRLERALGMPCPLSDDWWRGILLRWLAPATFRRTSLPSVGECLIISERACAIPLSSLSQLT